MMKPEEAGTSMSTSRQLAEDKGRAGGHTLQIKFVEEHDPNGAEDASNRELSNTYPHCLQYGPTCKG